MIGHDGAVKLADFGIAKETRVQTLSGSMHGTVTYMAPEQCRGHAFDRRADVFSIGVILYELVTGTRLFWADNDVASLHRVLSGTVPRPRKLRPQLSATLEEIVMTAVAHEQDKRFTTARDLADALEIYAAEAGEVLGARWISRWVTEILGSREVPWIGAPTVPDLNQEIERASSIDGSLVELIASLGEEEAPPNPTFGPTGGFADEIDTKPRRARATRSRTLLTGVIAFGLAGGAGVTALVMTRESAQVTKKIEARMPPPPPVEAVKPVEVQPPPPPIDEAQIPTETQTEPDRVRPHKKRRGPEKSDKGTAAAVVVEPPKPPPEPPPPAAGSGSQAKRPPKAEWNPDMLVPTDSGSGTKKKGAPRAPDPSAQPR